jgi:indole-3-acetate monooxygenase
MSDAAKNKLDGVDWPERARELAPMIAAASDQTESERRVPQAVMKALHDQGLFRMMQPKSIGGGESTPMEFMKVLEIVAGADASTAWCLGQGLGCSTAAGFVPHETAKEMFETPGILAWGPPTPGNKAVLCDGGYKATGRWRCASGAPYATWFGGHSPVFEADGETPVKDDAGKQAMRTMLMPAKDVTLHNVWDVIGLRGTGSDDYEVKDLFVPNSHTTWRNSQPDRAEDGPLYSVPLLTVYGMGFAGIALGIARAMLDEFVPVAMAKTGAGATSVLRENGVIQSGLGQAEAKVRSSRAFLIEMIGETWDVFSAGQMPNMDQRARLRLSISHTINQAREAVDFVYQSMGTNAIFENGPFERRFRDMHTVSQQGQGHVINYEFVGQAFMGMDPGHRV